ncbi:MAG: sulfatase-like hydrolase/transferase [Flavobacteriaceae bacterium]|nr:sulfatase-like hydrolase/transferase [Flavobacteriaceae bacterium]
MKKQLASGIKILIFYVLVGLILRTVLLFLPVTNGYFSTIDYVKIFLLGAVNDFCVSVILFIFLWLYLIFISDSKYKFPQGYIILGGFVGLLCYLFFFKTIFDDYGIVVSVAVRSFVVIKAVSFALLLFIPKIRQNWRYSMYCFVFFLYVFLIIHNAVGEFLFWNEFGSRYNVISVDYLIYVNKIMKNTMMFYPVIPLFSVLLLISVLVTLFFVKRSRKDFTFFPSIRTKIIGSCIYLLMLAGAVFLLGFNEKQETSEETFVHELQANGVHKFYKAYMNSPLDYDQHYIKIPVEKAFSILNKEYGSKRSKNEYTKTVRDTVPEIRKNVVLVSIESMSAHFMKHFGNTNNLTPNMDKLANEGMFFTNLYATGDRTERGLEAVTLCLPPLPGKSLVKRNNHNQLLSTGYLFKQKGYSVQFFYGGHQSLNTMETFFSRKGYQIITPRTFGQGKITFANSPRVRDEDVFNKAIQIFDLNEKKGTPFFGHIMTVSNHRPFMYPDGKIDISDDRRSLKGGVKYTDYAIGRFVEEAKKHSWFSNTIFAFVANHCADTGKTEASLALEKYHIPGIIYAPGFIQPKKVNLLASQIDIMPTIFGKLHFSYTSHFYGQDIDSPEYAPRALVATYQKLGYMKNNTLLVLTPDKKAEQYEITQRNELVKTEEINQTIKKEAIANYQTAAHIVKQTLSKIKN